MFNSPDELNHFLECSSNISDAELRKKYPADKYLSFDELSTLRGLFWYLEGVRQKLQENVYASASEESEMRARVDALKKVLAYFGQRKASTGRAIDRRDQEPTSVSTVPPTNIQGTVMLPFLNEQK